MQKATGNELNLRKADGRDAAFLLSVRNAPEVRTHSKTQGIISESSHATWFDAQLTNPRVVIWILEHQERRIGYVRAQETDAEQWLLSIALDASFQGKGCGAWAVRQGCRLLQEEYGAQSIVAEVLAQNAQACRLFRSVGFLETGLQREQGMDVRIFELTRS